MRFRTVYQVLVADDLWPVLHCYTRSLGGLFGRLLGRRRDADEGPFTCEIDSLSIAPALPIYGPPQPVYRDASDASSATNDTKGMLRSGRES
jgi:hypothetical protein